MTDKTLQEALTGLIQAGTLPEAEVTVTYIGLKRGTAVKPLGGIYTFYSAHREPLYVGISNNVAKRLDQHFTGKGNQDIHRYLKTGRQGYIEVFYEADRGFQELYENYLIIALKPRYNVAKTGRVRYEGKAGRFIQAQLKQAKKRDTQKNNFKKR